MHVVEGGSMRHTLHDILYIPQNLCMLALGLTTLHPMQQLILVCTSDLLYTPIIKSQPDR